jgi:hypothetical protein
MFIKEILNSKYSINNFSYLSCIKTKTANKKNKLQVLIKLNFIVVFHNLYTGNLLDDKSH